MTPEPMSAIRQQLQGWEHERQKFLGNPAAPNGIPMVLANMAHLFVYLDGNRGHVNDSHLTPYWNALEADIEKLSSALSDPWDAALRAYFVALAGKREEEALLCCMSGVRGQLAASRTALLSRLGVSISGGPEATFARLIGHLDSAESRTKLAKAWDRLSDNHLPELAAATDRVIGARWSRARAAGHDSPLAFTLLGSRLDEHAAGEYLVDYLVSAADAYRTLEAEVGKATGCSEDPMNHFATYLNGIASGQPRPLIPLSACVDTAVEVIETVFGHRVVLKDETDTVVLSLWSPQRLSGVIQVDCVPAVGARDPVMAAGIPIGRALARCRNTGEGRVLSFEAARSLMHEFGHAVNHVLLNPRRADLTGVRYLPAERLENLSAWFEKWVSHPRFAMRVPEQERSRLPLAARIKSTEFLATQLQRAVVAMLDFRLHRSQTSVTSAFQQIVEEFGVGGCCALSDLLPHFGAPVFRVHPGLAGLCYLWSYSYGAEVFRLADPREALRSCLDPDMPSLRPDITGIASGFGD